MNSKKTKPKVYVAMPCYDSVRVETMVSLLDTFSTLGQNGIEAKFKSVRSSLVTHARNLLTCGFMNSNFDYMLYVDADIEFQPEAVLRMLVPEEFIVCTPYRVKEDKMKYAVKFKDPDKIKILPWDMVELDEGPAGLMLIHRIVFERLIDKHPELKINFDKETRKKMNWVARFTLSLIISCTFLILLYLLFFTTLIAEHRDLVNILTGAYVAVLAKSTDYWFKDKEDAEDKESQQLHNSNGDNNG